MLDPITEITTRLLFPVLYSPSQTFYSQGVYYLKTQWLVLVETFGSTVSSVG